jgi:hypothetical protein
VEIDVVDAALLASVAALARLDVAVVLEPTVVAAA